MGSRQKAVGSEDQRAFVRYSMVEQRGIIEVSEAYFRKRVRTEAGLGWVAYPDRGSLPDGGVVFRFSTADRRISFPSIALSAEELAVPGEVAQRRLAAQKWSIWRAQYAAKRDSRGKRRRGRSQPRVGRGRHSRR